MDSSTALLKYGNSLLSIKVPSGTSRPEGTDPAKEVSKDSFTGALVQMIPPYKGGFLTVVVSDKTRLCGYDEYLPCLTGAAALKGYPDSRVQFLIAYGTHPPQTDEESLRAYGNTFRKYRFTGHNCDDDEQMVQIGTTTFGTRVIVRRELVESDAVILFGALSHHYFAGYGGGRKLIFPGLAARESIYYNHSLFIDFENNRLHPGCRPGVLEGNPVAEDLSEADAFFPEKIIISGILNRKGEVAQLITAGNYKEFTEGCALYDSFYRSSDNVRFDLVVASAGGYPKDINLIQAHKAIDNTASFVRDGGTLVIFAECADGTGSRSFEKMFDKSPGELFAALKCHYSGNGGTALALLGKSSRIKIFMVTSLDEHLCGKTGIRKIGISEAESIIASEKGSVALIENGSIIYR
ncbi:MAG: nickel-dependent lactate racemase [Bacteroidales bacterium]